MDYQNIILDRKELIGFIILNRPDKHNTFNWQLAKEMNNALRELENDNGINVVIIKAKGKSFCAGIDVSELAGMNVVEIQKWVKAMDEHNLVIANMSKPVIASVQGTAVANGLGLVAACDLAVASENSKFGATAINIGLFCFAPGYQALASIGKKRALKMVLTGDIISAKEAEHIGLVNKVVPAEELDNVTMDLATKLSNKSPLAIQTGKNSFYNMQNMSYESAIDYLSNVFALLLTTADAHEGVKAFLTKAKPDWQGH